MFAEFQERVMRLAKRDSLETSSVASDSMDGFSVVSESHCQTGRSSEGPTTPETTRPVLAPCLSDCPGRKQPGAPNLVIYAFPDSEPMEDVTSQEDSWLERPEMTCEDVTLSQMKMSKALKAWTRMVTLAMMALDAQANIQVVQSLSLIHI